MRPERDDYLDDDERGRFSPRRILASGWVRALIILGALAIVLTIAVPHVLRWLDGSPPVSRPQPRVTAAPPPPVVSPPPAPAAAPPKAVAAPSAPAPLGQEKAAMPRPAPAAQRAAAPPAGAQSRPEDGAGRAAAAAPPRPAAAGEKAATPPGAKAPAPASTATASRSAPRAATAGTGPFWVQVGAFQEARNAQRLAESLRARNLAVQVTPVSRGASGSTRHEVVVAGASVETVRAALRGTGTAQQVGNVVAVRPVLELREAVALSRRLAGEGLQVKIRRAGGGNATTYHVVRVGGYATRAAADAGRKAVEAHGLTGFVTQGAPR